MHCDHEKCRELIVKLLMLASKRANSIKEIERNLHIALVEIFLLDLSEGKDTIDAVSNIIRVAMDSREMLSEFQVSILTTQPTVTTQAQ